MHFCLRSNKQGFLRAILHCEFLRSLHFAVDIFDNEIAEVIIRVFRDDFTVIFEQVRKCGMVFTALVSLR